MKIRHAATSGTFRHGILKGVSKEVKRTVIRDAKRVEQGNQARADQRYFERLAGTPEQRRERKMEALSQDKGELLDRLGFAVQHPYAHGVCTLSLDAAAALLRMLTRE